MYSIDVPSRRRYGRSAELDGSKYARSRNYMSAVRRQWSQGSICSGKCSFFSLPAAAHSAFPAGNGSRSERGQECIRQGLSRLSPPQPASYACAREHIKKPRKTRSLYKCGGITDGRLSQPYLLRTAEVTVAILLISQYIGKIICAVAQFLDHVIYPIIQVDRLDAPIVVQ